MIEYGWRQRLPFHYAWLLLATICLAVFASIGLGRFTLGMILPSMGPSLDLSYAEMGWISTANFSGYFAAVLAIGALGRRVSIRTMIGTGLLLVGASLVGLALVGNYPAALLLYALTGIGSGIANMAAMGLLSNWFAARNRGKAAGFAVAGNGLAILLAGLIIPTVNAAYPESGWRLSWAAIGVVCLLVAALGAWIQRDRPQELGLQALGAAAVANSAAPPANPVAQRPVLIQLGLIYFGFGFTYVIYATFIVTKLVQENGLSEADAGGFWSWVGFLSLLSSPVFGALSDRFGRRAGLMLVLSLQCVAYLLAAFAEPGAALYLSIALFGLTAWSVPSMMAAAAGDYAGPRGAAAGLAFLTLFFGVGQIAGPALAGWLAESSGQFSTSFVLAAAMIAAAALLAVRLPGPAPAQSPTA